MYLSHNKCINADTFEGLCPSRYIWGAVSLLLLSPPRYAPLWAHTCDKVHEGNAVCISGIAFHSDDQMHVNCAISIGRSLGMGALDVNQVCIEGLEESQFFLLPYLTTATKMLCVRVGGRGGFSSHEPLHPWTSMVIISNPLAQQAHMWCTHATWLHVNAILRSLCHLTVAGKWAKH